MEQKMEGNIKAKRIHPLVAGAAISVMLVSLTGVAAITGILPKSHSSAAPPASVAAAADATPAAAAPALSTESTAKAETTTETEAKAKPAPVAQRPRPQPTRTAQASRPAATYTPAPVAQAPAVCHSCGRVESVQAIQQQAQPSGVGMIAGAVIGGALGNQVGGGNGRKLATVAGAIGGGYAGNTIEKNTRATTTYQVHVRMEGGELRSFPYSQQPAWSAGDRVRVVNGQLASRA
jgi:outer membrane lipoprotein SlyB